MKFKFLSVIVILIMSMLAFTGCNVIKDKEAGQATANEYFEFVEINGGYQISAKEGANLSGAIQLPATYNDKDVIAVAKRGFVNNTNITKVIIPAGYKTIGVEAFAYCTSLKTLEIGSIAGTTEKGVEILMSAFKGCTNLSDVKLGKDVKVIGAYAFYETAITSMVTLKNVESVGSNAFGKCSSLARFYVPASLVEIAEDAFAGCSNVKFEVSDSNTAYKLVNGELVKL